MIFGRHTPREKDRNPNNEPHAVVLVRLYKKIAQNKTLAVLQSRLPDASTSTTESDEKRYLIKIVSTLYGTSPK
jgi:hypothetical protein